MVSLEYGTAYRCFSLILLSSWLVKGEDFYNIAHQVNTLSAVDWAISQGANAVEVDLQFESATGDLKRFYHGPPCDCTCKCPPPLWFLCSRDPSLTCSILQKDSPSSACFASSPVEDMLRHLATKTELSLVYIDSKVDVNEMDTATMPNAAANVVQALTQFLFDEGYGGKVIVGAFNVEAFPYLKRVVEDVENSTFKDNFFFAYEEGKNKFPETVAFLQSLQTSKLIFGSGITACSPVPLTLRDTLELAAINKARGVITMSYTWTVDSLSDIEHNLDYVQGIITNYPARVRDVLSATGRSLADQSSILSAATTPEITNNTAGFSCTCGFRYRGGGCFIEVAAPEGLACKCEFSGLLRCRARIVQCRDSQNQYCQTPDTSYHSCFQGGGNCEGYLIV